MRERLSYEECVEALTAAQSECPPGELRWGETRRTLQRRRGTGGVSWELRLPWLFPEVQEEEGVLSGGRGFTPLPQPELLETYLPRVPPQPPLYVLLLIEAGQAALGVVENGEMVRHKVIRKYMVRKKQGKAQLTHLKTKGKSRRGSRIRLANSRRFFEEINERLHSWEELREVEKILFRCPIGLWSGLFKASTLPPFSTEDPRLFPLPVDLPACNFEQLQRLSLLATMGERTIMANEPAVP